MSEKKGEDLLGNYRIFETENFLNNIEQIAKGGMSKIKNKLSTYVYPQLRKEPHYGRNIRKLKDWEPQTWRYRIRNWRFFYEIDEKEKIIYLIAADHRKESYRK
jgi:mRNA interferase RelE/StbE